jgi:hypothetical protein
MSFLLTGALVSIYGIIAGSFQPITYNIPYIRSELESHHKQIYGSDQSSVCSA